jgi:sugar phosphate permease
MSGTAYKSRELRAFAPALILLAICALINYVDRGNLSIAAPLLKDELHISVTQLGILLSVFFLDLHRDAVCQRLDGGQL